MDEATIHPAFLLERHDRTCLFFFNYFRPPCSLLLKYQKSKKNQLGCIKSRKHVKNDTLSAIVWKKTNGCIKKNISTTTIEDISIFSVKPWILGGTGLSKPATCHWEGNDAGTGRLGLGWKVPISRPSPWANVLLN